MKASNGISVEERECIAVSYFKQGYNCCQSVAMAFADIIGAKPEDIAVLCSGFGGGMGRMREVCGAYSAMVMISGHLTVTDPSDIGSRIKNYALVQELAEAFRSRNGGSIICRELLGLRLPKKAENDYTTVPESPVPSERTTEYYKKRPCVKIVGNAARIIAEKLLENE